MFGPISNSRPVCAREHCQSCPPPTPGRTRVSGEPSPTPHPPNRRPTPGPRRRSPTASRFVEVKSATERARPAPPRPGHGKDRGVRVRATLLTTVGDALPKRCEIVNATSMRSRREPPHRRLVDHAGHHQWKHDGTVRRDREKGCRHHPRRPNQLIVRRGAVAAGRGTGLGQEPDRARVGGSRPRRHLARPPSTPSRGSGAWRIRCPAPIR